MDRKREAEWFARKDYQSHMKHHVLRRYLAPWASIVKQREAFFYDCFAGAGMYDDNELGSPVIAAQVLLDIQNKYREFNVRFKIRNVEHNKINYEKLVAATSQFHNFLDIRNYHMSFPEALPLLLSELDAAGERPALFFIDPFGYLDADPELILQIMSGPKREVLVNFMSYAVVRASGIDEEKWKRGIQRILGYDFEPGQSGLEAQVLNTYCNHFRKAGCFVCAVRIQSIDEPNIYFHLVHITKNWRGLKEMKNSMRENMKRQEADRKTRNTQMYLDFIDEFDTAMTFEQYKAEIISRYAGKGRISYLDFLYDELQYSPFNYSEIRSCIKQLMNEGYVDISGGSQDIMQQDPNTTIEINPTPTKNIQLTLF